MQKKGEYQRSGNQVNNFRQPGNFSNQNNQSGQGAQQLTQQPTVQNSTYSRNPKSNQEQVARRESGYQRNFNRENRDNKDSREGYQRQGYQFQNNGQKYQNRIRADETIDDIRADIQRIEKEIELEIKEIRSSKLGL